MPILEANQRFERYRIIQHLGSGTSGESYEAEDTMLARRVTFKLLHPWATLPASARRQFFREMQSISLLTHPYLATILDYGEIDNRLYVVRRYVTSGSLLSNNGRVWFQPPLSVPNTISYGHQLAQALAYIHSHGRLHGALTLSNILVVRAPNNDDQPDFAPFLVADVGLTHFVRHFGQLPLQARPITTAPEQVSKHTTPASDQFALAVLLYFWLAGCPPYLGSAEEIEHTKRTETITPLSSLNSHVTLEQARILRCALAVSPEERYPSILAFADALVATLTSPSQTTPVPDLTSQPEPLPQLAPEPLPQPTPEPLPQPAPEPLPQPTPEPLPEPAPEPLPQIDPDVYQPLPQPDPGSTPLPQIDLHAHSPRLIISFSGDGEPHEFLLECDEIMLGQAGSDNVLLNQDTSTSRHHALLRHEDDHYVIYDQRSTNGVFVNGQKLTTDTAHPLVDGDHIRIGNYELTFMIREIVHQKNTLRYKNRDVS